MRRKAAFYTEASDVKIALHPKERRLPRSAGRDDVLSPGCIIQSTGKEGDAVCSNFDTACRDGSIKDLAERYILECRKPVNGAKSGRVPNIAGFFRYCGFEGGDLSRLSLEYPGIYSSLCMIFEDEALNSGVSASVLTPYFKRRLGYGERVASPPAGGYDDGTVKLVFDHDIWEDGA